MPEAALIEEWFLQRISIFKDLSLIFYNWYRDLFVKAVWYVESSKSPFISPIYLENKCLNEKTSMLEFHISWYPLIQRALLYTRNQCPLLARVRKRQRRAEEIDEMNKQCQVITPIYWFFALFLRTPDFPIRCSVPCTAAPWTWVWTTCVHLYVDLFQ